MPLPFELDLGSVKAKHVGRRLRKKLLLGYPETQTHSGTITLAGPLKWMVKRLPVFGHVHCSS